MQGGWTALMFAALYSHTGTAAELVRLGADINARDKLRAGGGRRAVSAAAACRCLVRGWAVARAACMLTTARGGQDGIRRTALDIAKEYDKKSIVDLLTRAAVRLPAIGPHCRTICMAMVLSDTDCTRTHRAPALPFSPCWALPKLTREHPCVLRAACMARAPGETFWVLRNESLGCPMYTCAHGPAMR